MEDNQSIQEKMEIIKQILGLMENLTYRDCRVIDNRLQENFRLECLHSKIRIHKNLIEWIEQGISYPNSIKNSNK